MTVTVLKSTGQVQCRMSYYWYLSSVFLMIRLRLWVWERKTTEVECYFHYNNIKGTCYWHDFWLLMLTLISWQRSCFSGVSTGKFVFFLLLLNVFGRKLLCVALPSFKMKYLHLLSGIYLYRWVVSSTSFVALSIIFYISMHSWIFISYFG